MERGPSNQISKDTLTDVLDRRSLDIELARYQEESPGQFSVLMVDINDLKPRNDSEGHAAGDKLLKDAAQAIESSLRTTTEPPKEHEKRDEGGILDVISYGRHATDPPHQTGRYGGDEFVVILTGVDETEAIDLIVGRIEENLHLNSISASIGAATHNPEEAVSETLHRADLEMYQAKKAYKANKQIKEEQEKQERIKNLPRRKRIAAFAGKIIVEGGNRLLTYSSKPNQAS